MNQSNHHAKTIERLVKWAGSRDDVRAVLLSSTRAVPHAHVDMFSDYDVILAVRDVAPFDNDRAWVEHFGAVLVGYWDAVYPEADYGMLVFGNVIQYADGLKIDFTLWPLALLEQIAVNPKLPAELDAGYQVLVDKDGITTHMAAPSYNAYAVARPSNETYQTTINDFFSDVPYVAKCLWRDELLPAKWCLDYDMKHVYLRPMLEWHAATQYGWSIKIGALGKGLKKYLPPALWSEFETSFSGAGLEENWHALFRTIDVFRQAAIEVGKQLGYTYPYNLDQGVTAYAQRIRLQTASELEAK